MRLFRFLPKVRCNTNQNEMFALTYTVLKWFYNIIGNNMILYLSFPYNIIILFTGVTLNLYEISVVRIIILIYQLLGSLFANP